MNRETSTAACTSHFLSSSSFGLLASGSPTFLGPIRARERDIMGSGRSHDGITKGSCEGEAIYWGVSRLGPCFHPAPSEPGTVGVRAAVGVGGGGGVGSRRSPRRRLGRFWWVSLPGSVTVKPARRAQVGVSPCYLCLRVCLHRLKKYTRERAEGAGPLPPAPQRVFTSNGHVSLPQMFSSSRSPRSPPPAPPPGGGTPPPPPGPGALHHIKKLPGAAGPVALHPTESSCSGVRHR